MDSASRKSLVKRIIEKAKNEGDLPETCMERETMLESMSDEQLQTTAKKVFDANSGKTAIKTITAVGFRGVARADWGGSSLGAVGASAACWACGLDWLSTNNASGNMIAATIQ